MVGYHTEIGHFCGKCGKKYSEYYRFSGYFYPYGSNIGIFYGRNLPSLSKNNFGCKILITHSQGEVYMLLVRNGGSGSSGVERQLSQKPQAI